MQRWLWWLLALGMMVTMQAQCLTPAFAQGSQTERNLQHAGRWTAWVEATPVGNPAARAIPFRQVIYRQGPQDKAPVKLCEDTSTGNVHIALREDGLLFVQLVGPPPALYFPGTLQPMALNLPPPKRWDHPFAPYPDIAANDGHVSWQGAVLFYGRYAYPGVYLIGYVRVEPRRKRIMENRVCLEISPEQGQAAGEDQRAFAVSIHYLKKPFRAGDYIFWSNMGGENVSFPDVSQSTWKEVRVRVLNLKTGRIIPLEDVSEKIRAEQKEALLELVKR